MKLYRRIFTYAVAVGSTAIALLLTLWLKPFLSPIISPLFYIAIIVSTWYGGFLPGMVTVICSLLAVDYFLIAPVHQVLIRSPKDRFQLGIFLFVSLVIHLLTNHLQQSKRKIEQLSQQLIEENTEQLRMTLSAARVGMWDWNLVTSKAKWSPEHSLLLGLEPHSFDTQSETFFALVHPDDLQRLNQAIQQALETKSIYQHEFRVIWPDGSIHWLEGRGQGFYDSTGQAVRMTGTIMNIDQRKHTEHLLHQQFEQQRIVINISQRIRQSLNLQEILKTTVEEVRGFLQCDRVIIFQFDATWTGTVVVESVDPEWTAILSTQIYDPCFRENYIERYKQGSYTAKSDIYTAGIDACHLELLAHFQVRANLVVPLNKGQELWGLLIAHHCAEPRPWQPCEIALMQQVATQAGIAIQQAELVEQLQLELQQRQQTEIALRESEQKFRELAENTEDIVYIYTADYSQLLYINQAYEIIWQRTCQSLYENPYSFLDAVHPLDRDRLCPPINALLNNNVGFEEEYQIIRPDGSIRWIYDRTFFIYNEAGELYRIAGIATDITERKQAEIALQQFNTELEQRVVERTAALTETNARLQQELNHRQMIEEALQQSKAQLQHLVANTPGVIYRLVQSPDDSVKFEYLSPAAEEISELKVEQILENPLSLIEQIHPDDVLGYQVATRHAQETLEPFDHQWRIITPSRQLKWVHARSLPECRNDGSVVWYGIVQDISDRKQTEATIRETERRWRSLLNNVQLIVVGLDQQGVVNYVNPFFLKLTGYQNEEVLGKNWFENFLPPCEQQKIKIIFSDVLTQNIHPYYLNSILTKSGEQRFIAWNNTLLEDSKGIRIGTISIGEDITERQRIEEIKDEFIGIVSHELRTPLTAIQMSLGLLNTGIYDQKPEKYQRVIKIALLHTNRLVNLVNDILDLERLESGQVVINQTVCKAADLMQQAVDGIQAIATQQQVSFRIDPTDAEVLVAADSIIQTLTNLLSNAIKFSPPQSTIRLSAEAQIDCVLFQVSDQGQGIPSDKLDLIFGRFQQVDVSDSRQKGGTGLGLAICRSIIEQHGGKIWAESILGEGSTFFFTVPLGIIKSPPE